MTNFEIFKAYDIRGKVGSELNSEVAQGVGRAPADWLPNPGQVAVGYDMRPDSQELARAVISGLIGQGRDVIDIGLVATDMIYFAVGHLGLAGGAMVTASHNPGEYNGIKLCREEAIPIGLESGLDEIRDAVIASSYQDVAMSGQIEHQDVKTAWIEHVIGFVDIDKLVPLNIAVDAGNGMAGAIFPELEKFVPWQVKRMYFELDGTFPNHEANPMKFETLTDLIGEIRQQGLDAGLAFDGDGDRAFLVDETGEVLTGGVMSAMLADYFLDINPGAVIVYDARNSKVIPEITAKKGGKSIRTKVGGPYLKKAMREAKSPFGGEASGHFFFRDNWYADSGLIAAVIGLYILGISGKKLSELRQKYSYYATIPEANHQVEDKSGAIEAVAEEFSDADIDRLDGLTVSYPDGWLNIRASNTEPLLRLNAEAHDEERLGQIVGRAQQIISKFSS